MLLITHGCQAQGCQVHGYQAHGCQVHGYQAHECQTYGFDMIPVLVACSDPPGLWWCGVLWFGGKALIDDKRLICMHIDLI